MAKGHEDEIVGVGASCLEPGSACVRRLDLGCAEGAGVESGAVWARLAVG